MMSKLLWRMRGGRNRKVDNEANNEISKKDVLDAYGVRPPNPSPESQENKRINT